MPSITTLIAATESGDLAASDALFTALYSEMLRMAKRELARQGVPISLGPNTLLHQAYLEMSEREGTSFPDRGRFMGYAARVMRGLIIDHARRNQAQKRGGRLEITSLTPDVAEHVVDDRTLSKISDALDELAKAEPVLAEVVDLKFFCGFSFVEIGAMHGVTERTVQRQWEKARLYLHRSLSADLDL